MPRKPKKVEIGLRVDDMVILRAATRVGRETLMKRLRDLKAEMGDKILLVEKIDDALTRLDIAIAKAEDAYGVMLDDPRPASEAGSEG